MNVSLPEALEAYVDGRVARGDYGSRSEYIRELIRRDKDRQTLRERLLEGASSPPGGPADEAYFDGLRARIRAGTASGSK